MICVPLVHALHHRIHIRHERVSDEKEFGACVGLETGETEEGGLERFETGYGEVGVWRCGLDLGRGGGGFVAVAVFCPGMMERGSRRSILNAIN